MDEPSGGAERWSTPYSMSAKDEEDIERRVSALRRETGTDKQVIVTLITTKGLVRNRRTSERRDELAQAFPSDKEEGVANYPERKQAR